MSPAIPTLFRPSWIPAMEGVYLVGGCVRDLLLGRTPRDYDLVTLHEPRPLAEEIGRAVGGRPVLLGKALFPLYRVTAREVTVDVVAAEGGGIEEDLRRRDFTINALAIEAARPRLIDPLGGVRDLEEKRLRAASAAALERDPIRLLRAFRLAAQLGLRLEPETEQAIAARAALLRDAAGERVREELYALLACEHCHAAIESCARGGLLPGVLGGPGQPADGGMAARWQGIARVESLFEAPEAFLGPEGRDALALLDRRMRMLIKLVCLVPDSGEALQAAQRLRMSRRDATTLAELSCRAREAEKLLSSFPASPLRERLSFLRRAAAVFPGAVLVGLCRLEIDAPGEIEKLRSAARRLLADHRERVLPARALPPLLRGDELRRELGLAPSRLVGRILEEIALERLLDPGLSRREAMELARAMARAALSGPETAPGPKED
ncbi:MAG: hypothetical protein WHT06_09050 [Desulfobacterales bacterium]